MTRTLCLLLAALATTRLSADDVEWPADTDGVSADNTQIRHALSTWFPAGSVKAIPLTIGGSPEVAATLRTLKAAMEENPGKMAALIANSEKGKPLPYRDWFGVTKEEYTAAIESKPRLVPSGKPVEGRVARDGDVLTLTVEGEPSLTMTIDADTKAASVEGQPPLAPLPEVSTRDNPAMGGETYNLSWDFAGVFLPPSGGLTLMRRENRTVVSVRRRGLSAESNVTIVYAIVPDDNPAAED